MENVKRWKITVGRKSESRTVSVVNSADFDRVSAEKLTLQSELTKARELLRGVCGADIYGAKTEHIEIFLSNQSAPTLIETLHANGDRIAMEAIIAQQAQRIADLEADKGQREP